MIDLLNSEEKISTIIHGGYTSISVGVDGFGHVVLMQDDDQIWLGQKSLGELIKALQDIKNANSN